MSIKFLVLGGGVFGVIGEWGGKCRFYFYGRGDFSESFKVICNLAGYFYFARSFLETL